MARTKGVRRWDGDVGIFVGIGRFSIRNNRIKGVMIIRGTEAVGPDDALLDIAGRVDIRVVECINYDDK
jgi:hypothetical protein